MNDMSQVIIPKSDQVSADDFISGPRTYAIEGVEIRPGTEQPVSIWLANEPRTWKPCKSMCRVLVAAWGPDAKAYVGRSVTLYRDPSVKWGGMEVGGIRVSHLSNIERDMVMALTATKGKRAPFTVKMLQAPRASEPNAAEKWVADHIALVVGADDLERLDVIQVSGKKAMDKLAGSNAVLHKQVADAYARRLDELSDDPFLSDDNPAATEGPAEAHTDDDDTRPALVSQLIAHLAAARKLPDLRPIDAEFVKHRAAMADEWIAEIEAAQRTAKDRIAGGQG